MTGPRAQGFSSTLNDLSEGLTRAAGLHARGDLDGAFKTAKAVVSRHPDEPKALHFLGVVCCQAGRLEEGADYLQRALDANPADLGVRFNLARALLDIGRLDEAEQTCAASDGRAESPDLIRLRAAIAKAKGHVYDALQLHEQLVQQRPLDPALWNNLGNLRAEGGDFDAALKALQKAHSLDPKSATIRVNIGRVLTALRRFDEAAEYFAQAVRHLPSAAAELQELGETLRRLDQPQHALVALSSAARANPRNPEIFVLIGLAFAAVPDRKQAEQAFRMALRVDPSFAPAYLNLAIVLEQENRTDELETLAAQAEYYRVTGGEGDFVTALMLRRQGKLDEALRLAQSAQAESLDPAVRAHFVGLVADRIGDTQTAFSAFEEMNQLTANSPAGSRFSGDEHRYDVERMNALTTSEWVSSWRPVTPAPVPPSPVFLMGFLRSGTTLLDTILMGHSGTYVLEEDPLLARVERFGGELEALAGLGETEVNALRRRYFAELEANGHQPGDRLVIDKNPLAALRAPLIHRIFPDAKFVFAVRHPCDVVLSCYMQNFRASQAMASFFDLEKAALFYDAVMAYWQKCRDVMPLQVHSTRYEDLVEDVEGEVRPLLDYLGLDWDPAILEHQRTAAERGYIRTPSYAQVTEGIYTRSAGRWTKYREQMRQALPILAPWVERFGYEPIADI